MKKIKLRVSSLSPVSADAPALMQNHQDKPPFQDKMAMNETGPGLMEFGAGKEKIKLCRKI